MHNAAIEALLQEFSFQLATISPESKPLGLEQKTSLAFTGFEPRCAGRLTISFFVQPSTARVWAPLYACAAQPDAQMRRFCSAAQLRAFHPLEGQPQAGAISLEVRRLEGPGLVFGGGVPLVAELGGGIKYTHAQHHPESCIMRSKCMIIIEVV